MSLLAEHWKLVSLKSLSKTLATTLATILLAVSLASTASASPPTHELVKWKTSGIGVAYPDATDPTRTLPVSVQRSFQCVRYYESRNHLVDGPNYQAGWYQFTVATWLAGAIALGIKATSANLATGDQQSAVAVWYWLRNRRLGVQWAADASRCPGVF